MKVSDEMTRKLLAWLSRQSAAMRLEVFVLAMQLRREQLNRLRATGADARNCAEIEQQSLVAASHQMRNKRLKSSSALEEIAATRVADATSRTPKKSPKKDRLLVLMPQIIQLQQAGMSYAAIARLLSQQTRKKISRSYVHAITKGGDGATL